jgi:hypothetical protein
MLARQHEDAKQYRRTIAGWIMLMGRPERDLRRDANATLTKRRFRVENAKNLILRQTGS